MNVNGISPKFEGGLEFGGEELLSVRSTTGKVNSVEAGAGISFKAGLAVPLLTQTDSPLELQAMVGYKTTNTPKYTNGSATWSHNPMEVLIFKTLNHSPTAKELKLRAGIGVVHHLNNRFEGEGLFAPLSTDFKNATGAVFAADLNPSGQDLQTWKWRVGMRATMITYHTPTNQSLSGNSLGVTMTFTRK
jgi:hypothetical protein